MQCMTPYQVRDLHIQGKYTPVPCGKCPACYKRRVSAWSFRLMKEEKKSTSAHFITLTYDTSNVPITDHGYMSLDFRDTQLFFKKLRKNRYNCDRKLKYFLVGEYGGKTRRPHYHAIIFNADIRGMQEAWDKGAIHYGTVTGASIGYSLKYISKANTVAMHANDDRRPEAARMSKGLGKAYLSEAMIKYHRINSNMYHVIEDGRKIAMARYFKEKIWTKEERIMVGIENRSKMLEQFYSLGEVEQEFKKLKLQYNKKL